MSFYNFSLIIIVLNYFCINSCKGYFTLNDRCLNLPNKKDFDAKKVK